VNENPSINDDAVSQYARTPLPEPEVRLIANFLRRRWPLLLIATLLGVMCGVLLVSSATPKYTATASVAIENEKPQLVNVQQVQAQSPADDATVATEAAVLRSTQLISQLVDALHLDRDPEFNATLNPPKTNFSISHLVALARRRGPARAPTPDRIRAQVIASVASAIAIASNDKSYVITINVTSRSGRKAQAIANMLADLYIQDGVTQKANASRRASAYLLSRIAELRRQAEQSDRAAELYRASSGLTGTSQGATIDTQQLSGLTTELVTARGERASKEAQLAELRKLARGSGDVASSPLTLASSLIQRLREQESEVERNLANLQATFGPNYPKIINAQAELADLRQKILAEIRKISAATANEVAVAKAREEALQSGVSSIESRVNQGGQSAVRLRELERQAEADRGVYQTFLNRLKETSQDVDAQSFDARIVSPALLPLAPSSPRVTLTVGASMIAGLLAGILLGLLVERFDDTVRGTDVMDAIGGTVLGLLPELSRRLKRPEDTVLDQPHSLAAEARRMLHSALTHAQPSGRSQVIMVTSSTPNEGKTSVCIGLARVSAQNGTRTLLIDADVRRPSVHETLGINNGVGLIQLLLGEASLDQAVQRDPRTQLDVLTAGSGLINPPNLLRSPATRELIEGLRGNYDFIVLDTAPFIPMVDSQILSQLVDQLVFVVRWGRTPKRVVDNVMRQIRRLQAPFTGTVLTRVNFARQSKYGQGDGGYNNALYTAYHQG